MLDRLTADSFAPYEGTDFTVDSGEAGPLTLRLAEVTRFPVQPDAPRTEPFSLTFVGPLAPILPQRIYALEHPEVGLLEIFLVPLGPISREDPRMRYEAAFN
jgi:uncharacterized protein DUF6916